MRIRVQIIGKVTGLDRVAQQVRASLLQGGGHWFESSTGHKLQLQVTN